MITSPFPRSATERKEVDRDEKSKMSVDKITASLVPSTQSTVAKTASRTRGRLFNPLSMIVIMMKITLNMQLA